MQILLNIDKQLVALVQDFFLAGSDTTNNSIGFAILQLIHHPEIQAKLRDELDSLCGDSMPTLAHRARCWCLNLILICYFLRGNIKHFNCSLPY